jgi:hypothetical protein
MHSPLKVFSLFAMVPIDSRLNPKSFSLQNGLPFHVSKFAEKNIPYEIHKLLAVFTTRSGDLKATRGNPSLLDTDCF